MTSRDANARESHQRGISQDLLIEVGGLLADVGSPLPGALGSPVDLLLLDELGPAEANLLASALKQLRGSESLIVGLLAEELPRGLWDPVIGRIVELGLVAKLEVLECAVADVLRTGRGVPIVP